VRSDRGGSSLGWSGVSRRSAVAGWLSVGGARGGGCTATGARARAVASGLGSRATGASVTGWRGLGPVLAVGRRHGGDVLAGVGIENILGSSGRALAALDLKVGNEHGRQRAHLIAGTALDGDCGAAHVEFSVAESVLPGPSEDSVAGVHALGHRDIPRVDAVALLIGLTSHSAADRVKVRSSVTGTTP